MYRFLPRRLDNFGDDLFDCHLLELALILGVRVHVLADAYVKNAKHFVLSGVSPPVLG